MGKDKEAFLKITPIGGVGEIGSNCAVFETASRLVFVDYGILFPYEDFFDINYLIADLSGYAETAKSVSIFITHGHEDHIGAIAHINKVFPQAEIHAPKFAEKLVRRKLRLAGQSVKISVYGEDSVLDFEDYEIHPVSVTHSIPDTYGLVAKTKNGALALLFISDFKYDLEPLYERPFNTEKIKNLFSSCDKSVCMMDSTNILDNGKTPSERDLIEDLEKLVQAPGRLFITLFSSNIHRLRTVMSLALKEGKKVVPVGRSVKHYIEAANECGLFGDEISVIRDERQIQKADGTDKNIYLLTGCQGDHFGALRRVSAGEHKFLEPREGDTFVFSSKPIPGNENKIYRIYNALTDKGAQVVTHKDMRVHASGHPGREDLRRLYREISPDVVVPIHGESYFLKMHMKFLAQERLAEGFEMRNFQSLVFDKDGNASREDSEHQNPPILIHGKNIPIERKAISKRRKMACNGACFLSVNAKTRQCSITVSGLPESIDKDLEKIANLARGQLGKKLMAKEPEYIAEQLRVFTRNLLNNFLGYKPATFVHVI